MHEFAHAFLLLREYANKKRNQCLLDSFQANNLCNFFMKRIFSNFIVWERVMLNDWLSTYGQ